MEYEEFCRNVRKAGLTLKEFALLINVSPNSITNLRLKGRVPNHLAIIAALLGEMVDKKIPYKHLFEAMELIKQKPRRSKGEKLFVKKEDM